MSVTATNILGQHEIRQNLQSSKFSLSQPIIKAYNWLNKTKGPCDMSLKPGVMFIPVSSTVGMLKEEYDHKVEVSLGFKMNSFQASLCYRNTRTHIHLNENS